MRLRSLRIQGFRKHYDTKIIFSDSTFLIGENNVGKSSILYALDYLLNNKTKVNNDEYFSYTTSEGIKKTIAKEVVLTAVFLIYLMMQGIGEDLKAGYYQLMMMGLVKLD